MHSASLLSTNGHLPSSLHLASRPCRNRIYPETGSFRHLSHNKLNTARVVVRMAHTVFVYGTLLSKEIVNILLNRNPEAYEATVKGYSRYRIQGRVYPAILPTLPSDELTGMEFHILDGMVDNHLRFLLTYQASSASLHVTEYEDEDYYRTQATAHRQDTGEDIPADIYCWKDSLRDLLYGSWDYEEFRRLHLKEYMAMCQGFGADFTSKDMLFNAVYNWRGNNTSVSLIA